MASPAGQTQPKPRRARDLGDTSPYLIVFHGGIPGALHALLPPQMSLGRAPANTLRFTDDTVSRSHALFQFRDDRSVALMDLGSSAGTLLNGERLAVRAPRVLQSGDRLQFGARVILKFEEMNEVEEQSHREQFRRAVCDDLTGLSNRVFFLDQADLLIERLSLRRDGVGLMLIDVDRFKSINDSYGHETGDVVLRAVGQTLAHVVGSEDLAARYGGEEFVVATAARSLDQVVGLAERIRSVLGVQSVATGDGGHVRATVSIGVAYASWERPQPYEVLLRTADLCLYHAKRHGRDRVACERDCPIARPEQTPVDQRTHAGYL